MTDKKISELTAITGANTAADDLFIVVDSSGTATKKITRAELNNAIELDAFSTVNIDAGTIDGVTMATSDITVGSGKTLNVSAGTLTLADDQISGDKINGGSISSTFVGNLTGNASGTAATVTTAAQPAITSVGTLTGLGIGAAASAGKLHVTHTTGTIGYFESSQASANVSNLVGNSTQTNSSANLVLQVNGGTTAQALVRCNGDNSMAFFTGASPAERARLNATGLNIGGTTPVSPLTSEGDISIASTVDSDGGDLGEINFWNRTNAGSGSGTSFVNDVASIKCEMVGTGNNSGGSLKFFSKADGQSKTEALTITGDQKIGIGTAAPGRLLHLSSAAADTSVLRVESTGSHVAGIELLSGHGNWGVYNSDTVADALEFRDDSASATRMIITSVGRIGVGTTAPDSLVEIASGAATTAKVSTSATNSYAELIFEDGNAGYAWQTRSDNAQSTGTGSFVINDRDTATFPVVIKEGNATNTLVLSGSKVGINDSTPSQALSIGSSGSATPTYSYAADGEGLHFQYNDDSGARSADIIATGNTPAGATQRIRLYANTGSGDGNAAAIMTVQGDGKVGINVAPSDPLHIYKAAADSTLRFQWDATHAGKISFREGATETGQIEMHSPTDSDQPGNMKIATLSSGAGGKAIVFQTNSAEAARILSAGNLVIGATANIAANAKLYAQGSGAGVAIGYGTGSAEYRHAYMNSGDAALYFWGTANYANLSSAGAWTNASDRRIKKNIVDIKYGLEDVLKMQPRSFQMKEVEGDYIGLIAQEVEEIIPEVVGGDPEKQLTLDYGSLVAVAFKAIQEQTEQIEALKARVATLEED